MKKKILKQAGIYTLSTQITQFVTLIAAVLSRRFLGPTQMGIWATLQVIVDYSKYASLGAIYAVAKEVPYYLGKGEEETSRQIQNTVFTVVFFNTLLAGVGIFLFTFLTRGRFSEEVTYGFFLVPVIILLQRLSDLLVSLLRGYKKFEIASEQMITSAIINSILVAFLSYHWKIYGFMAAFGLSLIYNIVYIQLRSPFHLGFYFNWERLKSVLAFAFPMMLVGILSTVWGSIDKIAVAKKLGFEALGFYSIALMVSNFLHSFFNSIAVVLFPYFQEKYSLQDSPNDLRELLDKVSYAYALTMPLLIGSAWIVGPNLIALFLPKFTPGITAMQILGLSMFFMALAEPYGHFLITINKYVWLIPILGTTSLVALISTLKAIDVGWGITGVAVATTVSAWFNFTAYYFFASRNLGGAKAAFGKYFLLMSLGGYLGIVLLLIHQGISSAIHSFIQTGKQFCLFVVFSIPLLVLLNRETSLLSLIRQKVLVNR